MLLALILYGALAAFALWATWPDDDLRWIGITLAVSFIVSNIAHSVAAPPFLVMPYSILELLIFGAVAIAYDVHRRLGTKHHALLVLGGVNILSVCFNLAFACNFPPAPRQVFLWELTTNLCFAAECLLAAGVGVVDGLGTGRFRRMFRRHGRQVAADVARAKDVDAR